MHKIEIGKVGNFSAWNENFRAEISDFFYFFAERKLLLRTLPVIVGTYLLRHPPLPCFQSCSGKFKNRLLQLPDSGFSIDAESVFGFFAF